MPIFQDGVSVPGIRYIDELGVEHHVVQVWLGERLVWDGTSPALVNVPVMFGWGSFRVPAVTAGSLVDVPCMFGTGELLEAIPGGGGGVSPPVMPGTGLAPAPAVSGAVLVAVPSAVGSGALLEPGVGTTVSGQVLVPAMIGTGMLSVPTVVVPGLVSATLLTGSGEMLSVDVTAGGLVAAVAAAGSGSALIPGVRGAASLSVDAPSGSGSGNVPAVSAGATVAVPVGVGSGLMLNPIVSVIRPGLNFADDFNRTDGVLGSNWVYRNGTSYPRISGNQVAVGGTTDGYYECTWVTPCLTSEQYVECDMVTGGSRSSGIMLRYSTSGVGVILTWIGNNLAIFTTTGWQGAGGVNRTGDVASGTTLAGKRLRFTAIGNTYTGYVDGVEAIKWVDTGSVIPTTGRLGGLALQRANFSNSGSMDNWAFGDLDLTPSPGYAEAPPMTGSAEMHAPTVSTEVPAWSPMGMDKSGTQSCPTSYVAVTGWTPRSGYPGTSIVSNALVADGPATVTVYGKITISGGTLPAVAFRIKKNGVVIYTSAKSGSTQSGSVSVTLAAGDLLTMEAESSTYAGTPTIQAGADNTYLYFE